MCTNAPPGKLVKPCCQDPEAQAEIVHNTAHMHHIDAHGTFTLMTCCMIQMGAQIRDHRSMGCPLRSPVRPKTAIHVARIRTPILCFRIRQACTASFRTHASRIDDRAHATFTYTMCNIFDRILQMEAQIRKRKSMGCPNRSGRKPLGRNRRPKAEVH